MKTRLVAFATICLLAAGTLGAREATDVVVLANGDRITCEIKQLSRGLLSIKPDYTRANVSVEWIEVEEIRSSQLFEVEMEDGSRYFGSLAVAADGQVMVVMTGMLFTAVEHGSVVRISQIEEGFWRRLSGTVNLGLSARKTNSERGYSLSATTRYKTRRYLMSSSLNSSLSERDDTQRAARTDLAVTLARSLQGTWYTASSAKFERNEELGLDLRTTLAAGGGQHVIQTNTTLLSWLAGLAGTREWYAEAELPTTNLEGLLQLQHHYFPIGTRDTDLTTTLTVYPNISSWPRVRGSLDSKLRHELIGDFYVSLNLLVDYDSEPPTEAERIDWTVSSSVGYSF